MRAEELHQLWIQSPSEFRFSDCPEILKCLGAFQHQNFHSFHDLNAWGDLAPDQTQSTSGETSAALSELSQTRALPRGKGSGQGGPTSVFCWNNPSWTQQNPEPSEISHPVIYSLGFHTWAVSHELCCCWRTETRDFGKGFCLISFRSFHQDHPHLSMAGSDQTPHDR